MLVDALFDAVFVSGITHVAHRGCYLRTEHARNGCVKKNWQSILDGDICVCDTDFCNDDVGGGAVMTSSFGHVSMAVALFVSAVFGQLM